MQFGIVGTSIWQQNLPLLECLTIKREDRTEVLQDLKEHLGVEEMVYLTTCNRVELIYATSKEVPSAKVLHRLIDFFCCGKREISFFPNDFYQYTGKEAITHLFRTTASLESLVVGETQITGQFRQAFEEATELGLAGPALGKLSQEALVVAKKVKRDTAIGEGALSMASLAASTLLSDLKSASEPVIALVGSGAMTTKLAKYISESVSAELIFVNRTVDKAEKFAEQFGGRAVGLDEFIQNPDAVDGIVSATAATDAVFGASFLDRLPERNHKVVCIDLAIPRDFSSDFNSSDKVSLIDIPYLKTRGQGNLRKKFVEASKANDIVRQAVNQFLSDRIQVSLKPIFHESYSSSLQLAKQAVDDLFARRAKTLPAEEKEAVLRMVNKLIGHSAFQPVRTLSNHLVEMRAEISDIQVEPSQRKAV